MIEKLWTFDARGVEDAVTECLEALTSVGMVSEVQTGMTSILEREADGPTYVGRGMALPHIIGNAAREPGLLAAQCDPTTWGDAQVSLLLFLIMPELDDLETSRLADIMRQITVIGIEASSALQARQQTLELFQTLGAQNIERNQSTWA